MIIYKKDETFILYRVAFNIDLNIYFFQEVQIFLLDIEEIMTPTKYLNYTNIFILNFVTKLLKHISINNHFISPIDGKQPFYSLIYKLKLVKFKMLIIYININ